MTISYATHLKRIATARAKADAAAMAHSNAARDAVKWGRDRFMFALATRGIALKKTLILIKGERGGFRRVATKDAPAILMSVGGGGRPFKQGDTWWFDVFYARQKKRGGFRAEYLRMIVHGKTPEDAAKMVVKWGVRND